mmetsp:Transcript_12294/g.21825  ORF Transcript_12294/g.21825 Transcript_12294/m.21825 type:complete len:160 (+) Transcript_12294:76-555(+)|eukprot:CAMPEP_0197630376 /NCGR_PEP_ID=MMETSP1338-20131121/7887_1 /TAXON_ID=43686 ORGANISM="Pelagodinium beii, Strain RCC1491" /NCGR_SAMPLE_ID=MMETSP1338 /ASSEMBLY_ACC=CAM_ASM_000754 /LENGTH=159 /DNA_ID=CAMNT_0043201587 /DNA_START=68 /DNA_END=547 /DNA_ORIENTATION=+
MCPKRFLILACLLGLSAADQEALAADDECGDETCALNALQRSSLKSEEGQEGPMEDRRDERFLEEAMRHIRESLRDDGRRGMEMDKMAIGRHIREAKTNLMHVSNCPSYLPEARQHLDDALHEMNGRGDEKRRRREVHNHLHKALEKVKHCKKKERRDR